MIVRVIIIWTLHDFRGFRPKSRCVVGSHPSGFDLAYSIPMDYVPLSKGGIYVYV